MKTRMFITTVFCFFTFIASHTAIALTGDDIIGLVDKHEDGYVDLVADVEMILVKKNHENRVRFLKVSSIELEPLGDKRKYVFKQPADIKGTAILIHSKVIEDDANWIYLPAFKRVKRVSSTNKKTPFVGSQFSYEDLSSQEKEKYQNQYLGDANCDDIACYQVKRVPKYNNSGYSHLISYVDKDKHRFVKIDYFNKSDKLLKTQYLSDYKLYDNKFLVASTLKMTDYKTDKTTIMKWKNIKLKNALSESKFTKNILKRLK